MANIIESSDSVRDIVEEIEDINRYCDILRKLDGPSITGEDGKSYCPDYQLYNKIIGCLDQYKEILLDIKLYKGDKK